MHCNAIGVQHMTVTPPRCQVWTGSPYDIVNQGADTVPATKTQALHSSLLVKVTMYTTTVDDHSGMLRAPCTEPFTWSE